MDNNNIQMMGYDTQGAGWKHEYANPPLGHNDPILGVGFESSTKTMVSVSGGGTIKYWN